jgi:hypothetical protein
LTEYNVRDQVTAIKTFKGNAEIGAYCALGNCQQVENVYDGRGRLQKQYLPIYQPPNVAPPYDGNPSARSKSMQYYIDDKVHIETDPRGATATYSYNDRGLVTGISYFSPSGVSAKSTVTFTYDELGNRQTMANGAVSCGYDYNTLGQMMSESITFTSPGAPSGAFTINYDYGLAGQLKSVRDPFGDQINYNYNKEVYPTNFFIGNLLQQDRDDYFPNRNNIRTAILGLGMMHTAYNEYDRHIHNGFAGFKSELTDAGVGTPSGAQGAGVYGHILFSGGSWLAGKGNVFVYGANFVKDQHIGNVWSAEIV